MHVMMEVSGTGRSTILARFDSFELACAALTARPDLVFSEPDADNPECADAFLKDGRLLVIDPADRRPPPSPIEGETIFTIERSYLVPVYQRVTVEADDIAAACAAVLDEDSHPWENDKVDYESARRTSVTGAWLGPTPYDGTCLRADLTASRATDAPERFTFACPHCASTNLTWDAITRWDVATQSNVVVTLLDTGSCEDCCAEIKQADRIPLDTECDG